MYKVLGIVTESFQLSTELVNQESLADAGLLSELVFVKSDLSTVVAEAKKTRDLLLLLLQMCDTLDGDFCKECDKVRENWTKKAGARRDKMVTAESTPEKIRLMDLKAGEVLRREQCS